jgi:hypothetical protein
VKTDLATNLSKYLRVAKEYGIGSFICENKLRVRIEVKELRVRLTIWRFSKVPSNSEWHSLLDKWPYFVAAPPHEEHKNGFYSLTAELGPLQEYLF